MDDDNIPSTISHVTRLTVLLDIINTLSEDCGKLDPVMTATSLHCLGERNSEYGRGNCCFEVNKELVETGRKEMFYLTTRSTHFIYGYMASDIC